MSLAIDVLVKPGSHMPQPPTCDIAANTAWDTVLTYQNIPRRQQETSQVFIAGMPSKLNSRHAGGKELERLLLPLTSVLMSNCFSGSTSDYVAGMSEAYEYQALFCVFFNLFMEWNGME